MKPSSNHLSVLARPAFSNAISNPYNAAIYGHIAGHGIDVHEYSWVRALHERHHIVHVHWPESTFNHRLIEALATTETLLWLLRRQQRRGTKIMWTVHNLRAHDARFRSAEDRFWNAFVELVDGLINVVLPGNEAAKKWNHSGIRKIYTDLVLRCPRRYLKLIRRLQQSGLVKFAPSCRCRVGMFAVKKKKKKKKKKNDKQRLV